MLSISLRLDYMKTFKNFAFWVSLGIGLNAQATEPWCAAEKAGDCLSTTVLVVNAIGTRTRMAEAAIVQRGNRQFYVLSRDDWPVQRRLPDSVSEPDGVSVGNLFMDQSLLRRGSGFGGRKGP